MTTRGKLLLGLGLFLTLTGLARADVTEVRDFAVLVDGKQAGYTQLVITERADGTIVVSNRAHAQVKLFLTFTFSFQGTEIWRNYQLLRMDGVGKENRQQHNVSAILDHENRALRLRVNNQEQMISPDVWTATFWRLPQIKQRVQTATILKNNDGTLQNVQIHYQGTVKLALPGQPPQDCYHFRVVGGNKPIDAWFDVQHRLVRQEFVERGHRTIVEMVNVRRLGQPAQQAQPAQRSE